IQKNTAFIQQLNDGRTMLKKCLTWCSSILEMKNKSELYPFILNASATAALNDNQMPSNLMLRKMLTQKTAEKKKIMSTNMTHKKVFTTKTSPCVINANKVSTKNNNPVIIYNKTELKSIELK